MTLRVRLTLYYTVVLAFTLFLFSSSIYLIMVGYLNRETDRELSSRAREVLQSIKIVNRPLSLQQVILPDVDAFSSADTYLQVVNLGGGIIARSRNMGGRTLPVSQDELARAITRRGSYQTVAAGQQRLRLYNVPLRLGGNNTVGYLQVGRSLGLQLMMLGRLRWLLSFLGIVTVLAAASLGYFLAKAALRPIDRVTQVAAVIGESADLTRRIPYQGPPDEVGRLASTFNGMLQKLQEAYQSLEDLYGTQKRFVADASHELRTPLTTIRGNIDLLRRLGEQDPEERAAILADLADEAERMARLLNNLLALARADADQSLVLTSVDLGQLVNEVVRSARGLGEASFEVQGLEQLDGVNVQGHRDYLQQLLLILLDNAFQHTPAGGRVTLAVCRHDGWIGLSVADTGAGIPAEHLPHIFERFYQADPARSSKGTGLGLAIARWIADQHLARLEVESQPGRGSTFTLWVPLP